MKIKDRKSLKAWLTRKRNLRDLLMLQHRQAREEEDRRGKEAEAVQKRPARNTAVKNDAPEDVWSAKTQEIRNRMTGKKRSASERWNRFAGTGDGGGRGL